MNREDEWRLRAACRGRRTEYFFAPNGTDPDVIDPVAADLCAGCPVFEDCLDYALRHRVEGTWAGTTYRGRNRLRRERGIRAVPVAFPTFEPEPSDAPEENIA